MGKPQFTPGPWCFGRDEDGRFIAPDRSDENQDAFIICHLPPLSTRSIRDENLITAAPDLYEALDAALAQLEEWQSDDGQGDAASIVVARAALAKARGEGNQ